MTVTRSLLVIGLIAGLADISWAGDSYVCSVRIDTNFAKATATSLPSTSQVSIKARLYSKPYCQGQSAGEIAVKSPLQDPPRKRSKVAIHNELVRNSLQGTLSTFLVFGIAAAQGSALNRAITIRTDGGETAPHDYGFQAMRPATTNADKLPSVSGSGDRYTMTGYVCLARNKFLISDDQGTLSVNNTHNFEISLYSKPFCLGKEIARREYDFGPPTVLPRKRSERTKALTAGVNAAAVMHMIYIAFVEAAMAGQLVTVQHDAEGLIAAVEIKARARNLVKETSSVARPGGY